MRTSLRTDSAIDARDNYQGRFFKAVRRIFRIIRRRVATPGALEFKTSAVYVGHHQNMRGPLNIMIWLDVPMRLWVLNVFFNKERCRRQFAEYTFRIHYHFPVFLASFIGRIGGAPISRLMRSMGAIEVFRKDEAAKAIRTFKQSIDALMRGERILIFPDVDNERDEGGMRDIYKGFLYLEKYYFAKTGEHLEFIPIHFNNAKRRILLGESVRFPDGDIDQLAEGVRERLVRRINALAE